jgi:hypothetical protein
LVLGVAQLHEGSVGIVAGIEGGAGVALSLPLRLAQLTVGAKNAAARLNRQ